MGIKGDGMIIAIPKECLFEFLKKNETHDGWQRILLAKDRAALAEYEDENRYLDCGADLDDYVTFEIKELPL